jgi:hypothetical protein
MAYTLIDACEPFAAVDDITCDCEGLGDEEIEDIIAQATDALCAMTGFRYRGQCTETFLPVGAEWNCHRPGIGAFTVPSPVALLSDGEPDILVTIDGDVFTDWRLVDGNQLIRTDGKSWPTQELDGTDPFVVTVTYGDPPSIIARNAVVEIACLFLKRNPNNSRGLPTNTRTVSSQGVSITMEALESEIKHRAFMMPWTIRFMTVYAPQGRSTPYVFSPELDGGVRLHQTS